MEKREGIAGRREGYGGGGRGEGEGEKEGEWEGEGGERGLSGFLRKEGNKSLNVSPLTLALTACGANGPG
jgi:hypothetical protein